MARELTIHELLLRSQRLLVSVKASSADLPSRQAALKQLPDLQLVLEQATEEDLDTASRQGILLRLNEWEQDVQRYSSDTLIPSSTDNTGPLAAVMGGAPLYKGFQVPRYGGVVRGVAEHLATGVHITLQRQNSHSWLSEHMYPVHQQHSGPPDARDGSTSLVEGQPPGGGTTGEESDADADVGLQEDLEIETHIGEGGFGIVFKGTVKGAQGTRTVAIKTLKQMMDMLPEDKAQFRAECQLHINLRHPNVVRCFQVWDDKPPVKMILEYSEIGSLHSLLRDSKRAQLLRWSNKLKWALDIAKGLRYLHSQRILHGDIKSHNILLFEQEPEQPLIAKISDFGMAKVRQANAKTTNVGSRKGTVAWQPPEVYDSGVRPLASDVYSFAMVMYELAAHKEPYHEMASVNMIVKAITTGKRPKMDNVRCPPAYCALMERCWATNPEDRPQFCEVCQELHQILADEEYPGSLPPIRSPEHSVSTNFDDDEQDRPSAVSEPVAESAASKLLNLRNSRSFLWKQRETDFADVRQDLPKLFKDLKGPEDKFLAAAQQLAQIRQPDSPSDASGYLQQVLSKGDVQALTNHISKSVCAVKRVAMDAVGSLSLLSRTGLDLLNKYDAPKEIAQHLSCRENACQISAVFNLHKLMEAWSLFGSRNNSANIEQPHKPSPKQLLKYWMKPAKNIPFISVSPVPDVVSKYASPSLIHIVVETPQYAVVQELASDILLEIAGDSGRVHDLHANHVVDAAMALMTVEHASEVLQLKGVVLLQRLVVPQVNSGKDKQLQLKIIEAIMDCRGEVTGVGSCSLVEAIAVLLCSSNATLAVRAAQLLTSLACTDEYKLEIAHSQPRQQPTCRTLASENSPPMVFKRALGMLTNDFSLEQQLAALRLLKQLASELSGQVAMAIVKKHGIIPLQKFIAHPDRDPSACLLALQCLRDIGRVKHHKRLMFMYGMVPTLVDVARRVRKSKDAGKPQQLAEVSALLGSLSSFPHDDGPSPQVMCKGGVEELAAIFRTQHFACMTEAAKALAALAKEGQACKDCIYSLRLMPEFVMAVKVGAANTAAGSVADLEVRGAAAAVLAQLAQHDQYTDEILAAEPIPDLLRLLDAGKAGKSWVISACQAVGALCTSPSAQQQVVVKKGLPVLVSLLESPLERFHALTAIRLIADANDPSTQRPLYLDDIRSANCVSTLVSIALERPQINPDRPLHGLALQGAALRVLRRLCVTKQCRAAVMTGGAGAKAFAEALNSIPVAAILLDCVDAVADIATEPRYCHHLDNSVIPLTNFLMADAWIHKQEVCRCLTRLASGSPTLQRSIVEKGIAGALANLLKDKSEQMRIEASKTVVALASGLNSVCQNALTANEALLYALISLLNGPESTTLQAVVAFKHLSDSNPFSTARLVDIGVVVPLAQLLQSSVQSLSTAVLMAGRTIAPLPFAPSLDGSSVQRGLSSCIAIAKTIGTLCKDPNCCNVFATQCVNEVVPAMVHLASYRFVDDSCANVLNTLQLLAAQSPQAKSAMVQKELVTCLVNAWEQHKESIPTAIAALRCGITLGSAAAHIHSDDMLFYTLLDIKLTIKCLLDMMVETKQPQLQLCASEALKTFISRSTEVQQRVVAQCSAYLTACTMLMHSSHQQTLQATFWGLYIMIKRSSSLADKVALEPKLVAHLQKLSKPGAAAIIGAYYPSYAAEVLQDLHHRNPALVK